MRPRAILMLTMFLVPMVAHGEEKKTTLEKVRAVLAAEPQIKEVTGWALGHYKLEPSRIDGMATAARLKGLVPEIEGGFTNELGHTYANTRDGLYPILPNPAQNPNPESFKDRTTTTTDSLRWNVRAVWNLDRLVFNAEALDVRSLSSLQEGIVREVITVYFERRRFIIRLFLAPSQDPSELFFELTRLDELTAKLDTLCGGRFASRAWKWDK
jgi:hypothetical protein